MAKAKEIVLTGELNSDLAAWYQASLELAAAKEKELNLRLKVVGAVSDPTKLEGSQTLALPHEYKLRVTKVQNYTLTNKQGETAAMLHALQQAERVDLASALVDWKPDLSLSNYRDQLVPLIPTIAGLDRLVAAALTIKPGTPQVELITPKEAKK